ncbi:MAG: metallophosphoesterase [Lachnospiraceae bacterium]|nr:metallophosphoesterase [Lachnospiraceae bacterium]
MEVTKYLLPKNIKAYVGMNRLRIVLAADLHNKPYEAVIAAMKDAKPDMIAVAGDLMCERNHAAAEPAKQENALGFLTAAVTIAPTFYSPGNHETFTMPDGKFADMKPIIETGAVFLDDSSVMWNGIHIGGLSSPAVHTPADGTGDNNKPKDREPNLLWLNEFDQLDGFKILLCHQPEYYPKYLKSTSVDMILSGHAHGGQWRFFGQGIFAPGQGWFPKLTSGIHEERLVISRGLANTARIPRICNETELVIIDVI